MIPGAEMKKSKAKEKRPSYFWKKDRNPKALKNQHYLI